MTKKEIKSPDGKTLEFADSFYESIADLPVEEQQSIIDSITEQFMKGDLMENSESLENVELSEEEIALISEQLDRIIEEQQNEEDGIENESSRKYH